MRKSGACWHARERKSRRRAARGSARRKTHAADDAGLLGRPLPTHSGRMATEEIPRADWPPLLDPDNPEA